jgi:hypothetical protein
MLGSLGRMSAPARRAPGRPAPGRQQVAARLDPQRGRLLNGLFWGGVGLAPLAILVVLFGGSTAALRVAVALAVLTVVLLAVSIALRPSIELLRVDIEERVLDEVEQMRAHIREDIVRAGRVTQRALGDQIHALTETVAAQHHQVAALHAQMDQIQVAGVVPASPAASRLGQASGPGLVRRTETVHVTRRTTTVDASDNPAGTVYGSRSAVEGDWTDRGTRSWHDEEPHRHEPHRHRGGAGPTELAGRWDEMSAGDRWASVRSDERGRELRLGERRSSVHADQRGSEMHVEDRWTALRRDDPRDARGDGDYAAPDWDVVWSRGGRAAGPAALPGPSEPVSPHPGAGDEPDGERARSRGREREDRRSTERDYTTDRERDHPRDAERGYPREADHGYSRDGDHGYSRDGDHGYSRDGDRGHSRDTDRGYPAERDRERPSERGWERPPERDRDRGYPADGPGRARVPYPDDYDR